MNCIICGRANVTLRKINIGIVCSNDFLLLKRMSLDEAIEYRKSHPIKKLYFGTKVFRRDIPSQSFRCKECNTEYGLTYHLRHGSKDKVWFFCKDHNPENIVNIGVSL